MLFRFFLGRCGPWNSSVSDQVLKIYNTIFFPCKNSTAHPTITPPAGGFAVAGREVSLRVCHHLVSC